MMSVNRPAPHPFPLGDVGFTSAVYWLALWVGTLGLSLSGCRGGDVGQDPAAEEEFRGRRCGDGTCDGHETCSSCAIDCGSCAEPPDLSAPPDLDTLPNAPLLTASPTSITAGQS